MACCLSKPWDNCTVMLRLFVIVFSVYEHLNLKLALLCGDYRMCGAPVIL
jgi:hypothetical protein